MVINLLLFSIDHISELTFNQALECADLSFEELDIFFVGRGLATGTGNRVFFDSLEKVAICVILI